MIEEMIRSTKKVIHWFNVHKYEIAKGVLGVLVIGFTDGKVTIDVSDTVRNRYRPKPIPKVKSSYVDSSSNSATAAIDMFEETGLETSSDYYRLEAVEKIEEILTNTSGLTDATKQYAITAISKMRAKCVTDYYRREINDIVVNILGM